MGSWDFALLLALAFSGVRIVAVLAGLWYQGLVTWDRYQEKQDLCASPKAPAIECEFSAWHFERGWLLLMAHALLALLTGITTWARTLMPPPHNLDTAFLAIRAGSDLTFTAVVVVLAVVSFRARVHQMRQLALLQTLEDHVHPEPGRAG